MVKKVKLLMKTIFILYAHIKAYVMTLWLEIIQEVL